MRKGIVLAVLPLILAGCDGIGMDGGSMGGSNHNPGGDIAGGASVTLVQW